MTALAFSAKSHVSVSALRLVARLNPAILFCGQAYAQIPSLKIRLLAAFLLAARHEGVDLLGNGGIEWRLLIFDERPLPHLIASLIETAKLNGIDANSRLARGLSVPFLPADCA